MSVQVASADIFDDPIAEMNTTPLIDVMLVLLVMFIISIPLQTHAVKIDLPTRGGDPVINPLKNKIVIEESGAILWNAKPISLESLTPALRATLKLPTQPELHLEPQPTAPYERVDQVLAVTKRVGVEQMGFVGNERYRDF